MEKYIGNTPINVNGVRNKRENKLKKIDLSLRTKCLHFAYSFLKKDRSALHSKEVKKYCLHFLFLQKLCADSIPFSILINSE